MDSDPEDGLTGLIEVLDCSVPVWTVNGVQRKKEG